ncbi:MAG: hypothetical protein ACOYMZ_01330 [Minisyncoccia bacterium]
MSLFQVILADIKKKLDKETGQTEIIARVATTILGITITPSMVLQKGSHISIKLPPTARMALTLKRPELLQALQKESITVVSIG